MTAPQDRDVSNAALLRRIERIEAELRRISGVATSAAGGSAPGADADAWIRWAARRDTEAGQLRRALGDDPALYRPPRDRTA